MKPRPLQRLARNDRGGAAVEFALIVPVLAAMLAGLVLAWGELTQVLQMRSAVHAGADYLRAGGSDPALVRTVIELAWEERPETFELTVVESCSCGTVVGSCTVLCPTNQPPSIYTEIRASSGGRSAAEVVRVR